MLDEILKDLFDADAEELIRLTLSVGDAKIVDLPVEFPVTDVKKPDKVWEVRYAEGLPAPLPPFPSEEPPPALPFFLLNVDFQAWNERTMVLRMADYHLRIASFGFKRYGFVPQIRQAVLYVGYDELKMPSKYCNLNMQYGFELLNARDFSAESFLRSKRPGVALFAALSGRDKAESLRHVERVVSRLMELNLNPTELQQYLARLMGLSRARKIVMETNEIILDKATGLPLDWVNQDPLYNQGIKLGEERGIKLGEERGEQRGIRIGRLKAARAMLEQGFPLEAVAKAVGLNPEEILNE
ncbi:MAG: hypothetical protein RMM53_06125 [Bacteroidia bacterium]|nr:hypothetical protein [Bacteroidia bacterium]MDW8333772.1 hypothetical protein [Bacteroidia bacterium]